MIVFPHNQIKVDVEERLNLYQNIPYRGKLYQGKVLSTKKLLLGKTILPFSRRNFTVIFLSLFLGQVSLKRLLSWLVFTSGSLRETGSAGSTISFIIFRDFSMFYQIFLSLQVKR